MADHRQSALSWALLAFGLIACLAAAYGAYTLAGYSWGQVVDYKSPYARTPVPYQLESGPPEPGKPLSARVVLVIVDGMRNDVSRSDMPTMQKLRSYGSDVTLVAAQPSLSYPNWTNILSGAPPVISGVTTNYFEGRVPVPTILDVAEKAGRRVAVVAPTDFETLYGVKPGPSVQLREWPKGGYLSSTLVDDALRIAEQTDPELLVVHLPDLDEAGHEHGGGSAEYRDVAGKIDRDIARLVEGLQREDTSFVVTADHGHIDAGGHGGWETEVVNVPAVFTGGPIRLGTATGELAQMAPTLSVIEGLRPPAYAASVALSGVLSDESSATMAADKAHHLAFDAYYVDVVTGEQYPLDAFVKGSAEHGGPDGYASYVRQQRVDLEQAQRQPIMIYVVLATLLVFGIIAAVSWRAFVAGLAGVATYYVVYNVLFFWVHGYLWSLSAFNTETQVQAFMNGRLLEAAIAALVGVAVAAAVYPLMRHPAWGPQDRGFLAGWLALAPATLMLVLGTLAVQVAWFVWQYGASVTWILPDFKWAFKYDLDLVQMTAVGAAVLLAPVVTYLIGRYHPRVRRGRVGGKAGGSRTHVASDLPADTLSS